MSNAAFNENANSTSPNIATPGGDLPKKPKHMMLSSFYSIMCSFVVIGAAIRLIGVSVITGQSMEPTFHDGDVVAMQRIGNHYMKGQCIIFNRRDENGKVIEHCIKRIVATEGDVVTKDKNTSELFVNGESLFVPELPIDPEEITETPVTVPSGYVFAVGDNYNHSVDSRYSAIGLVPEKEIWGKVVVQISKEEGIIIVDQTPRDYGA